VRHVLLGTAIQHPARGGPRWWRSTGARIGFGFGFGFLILLFATLPFQFVLAARDDVERPGPGVLVVAAAVLDAALAVAAYVGVVALMDRRRPSELSLRGAGAEFGLGALLGAAMILVSFGLIVAAGGYDVGGFGYPGDFAVSLAAGISAGFVEEIVFRGLFLRVLEEGLGTWLALAATALLFGLVHLGNENATLWGAVAIAIEAGILLGAVFVLTRRLWAVVGLHVAWNFVQGAVVGSEVSGTGFGADGLIDSEPSGPDLVSGGVFGVEASVVTVVVCVIVAAALLWWAVKADRIVQPAWARARREGVTG
jgi:hypothetical protein